MAAFLAIRYTHTELKITVKDMLCLSPAKTKTSFVSVPPPLVKLKPVSLKLCHEFFVTDVHSIPEFRVPDPRQPRFNSGPEFEPETSPFHLHQHGSHEQISHRLSATGQIVVTGQVALFQRLQMLGDVTKRVLRHSLVVVVVRKCVLLQELWVDILEAYGPED